MATEKKTNDFDEYSIKLNRKVNSRPQFMQVESILASPVLKNEFLLKVLMIYVHLGDPSKCVRKKDLIHKSESFTKKSD